MSVFDYNFNMSGIKVSEMNKSLIHRIMESLVSMSPSDGKLSLCLVNGENQVDGFLSIASHEIQFDTCHNASDPISVVRLLSKDLVNQIQIWKSKRVF